MFTASAGFFTYLKNNFCRTDTYLFPPAYTACRGEAMACCWKTFGLTAAAFGLGLLLATLLPPCILVPVASILLIAVGTVIHLR